MKLLMGTKQFKMYLDEETVERLETLAARHGRRSAQQIVEELLDVYLPVWSTVSDSVKRAIAYQTDREPAPVVAHIGNGQRQQKDEIRPQLEEETIPAGNLHVTRPSQRKRKTG